MALAFSPSLAAADEPWSPPQQELEAVGSLPRAAVALERLLGADGVDLCAFVDGRAQISATATGFGVRVRCANAAEPVLLRYGPRQAVALSAISQNDRLHLCATRDGGPYYGRMQTEANLSCQNSTARYRREVVRQFVTIWTVLARANALQSPDEATVRDELQSAPAITPDVQEGLRRTQVQVELAIRENRTLDAADLYTAALNAAPRWADGQFNQALLLGDLEFYPSAIRRMRMYLVLAPNASDARAARDRIYEWEAAMAANGQ
ncbi:MAG: hypothetical protein NW206_14575 [Hyphomonadaceae bacterium]|nr:hypothetical protein [Hyphomonadaceae bacterium]